MKKKRMTAWLFSGILTVIAVILLISARRFSGFAPWYGEHVYPRIVGSIGRFFGIVPFSMSEVGLYFGIFWLMTTFVKNRKNPMKILRFCCVSISVLLFSYTVCCGVNYYRTPFSYYYRNAADGKIEITEENLKEMCVWLTQKVNESHKEMEAAESNYGNMQEKGVVAMKKLAEKYPVLDGFYPQPKPVMISEILSWQQCSGVYSPFTVEANYNRDMTEYNIPHTICHELSHLRGFMREDEANFIGYLACIDSADADFRYSGYLLGWIYAGNALAKVDFEEYRRLHGMLSEAVRLELTENSQFWEKYESTVAQVQETVNDAYLKVNGQSDGVKSYGRVVDLMLEDFLRNK